MSENKNHDTETVESTERRSFMKKGALATGALALGLGSAGTAAAQDGSEVLVYTYDYHPNVQFQVEDDLQQSAVIRLLQQPGGGDVPEISQPDDYNGWIIRYRLGDNGAAITSFLFGRDVNLSQGDQRRFASSASIFSGDLNLLSTNLSGGDGGNGGTTTTQNGGGGNNSSN